MCCSGGRVFGLARARQDGCVVECMVFDSVLAWLGGLDDCSCSRNWCGCRLLDTAKDSSAVCDCIRGGVVKREKHKAEFSHKNQYRGKKRKLVHLHCRGHTGGE